MNALFMLSVFIAMSHADMTYTMGRRDKKMFAINLLGALGTAYRLYGVSADLLGLPYAEYFNGWDLAQPAPFGTTCRVIWGICGIIRAK